MLNLFMKAKNSNAIIAVVEMIFFCFVKSAQYYIIMKAVRKKYHKVIKANDASSCLLECAIHGLTSSIVHLLKKAEFRKKSNFIKS